MYCIKCGTEIGSASICPICGAMQHVNPDAPVVADDVTAVGLSKRTLTWAILSVCFSCTGLLSFLGIVFSKNAFRCANVLVSLSGELTLRAKVARIIARVGFILGIVMTALFGVFIVLLFIALVRHVPLLSVLL